VVVDEAGMLDTRLMEEVIRHVRAAGGKVVLVGDARQLQPIEAGGPFRAIGEIVGEAELTQIIRQRDEWARDSVKAFSRGDSAEALRAYTERGLVHVTDDRIGAMRELISRWKEKALSDPSDSLIFAGEKREVSALNRMAQEERSKAGLLGSEEIRVGADAFHAGDRVLFTRNSRAFGLRNGDLGTVVEVQPERQRIAVRLDGGQVVVVPLDDYADLKLGYAITTHKGQGVTCENSFVLAGGGMQDRHLTYVQASRARGETRLFIDRLEAGPELTLIARRMEQERFKMMASEVLRQSMLLHQQQNQPQHQPHTPER
ncbi:MAG: AAA family ATPase, partial [Gemmataceae bacterium]